MLFITFFNIVFLSTLIISSNAVRCFYSELTHDAYRFKNHMAFCTAKFKSEDGSFELDGVSYRDRETEGVKWETTNGEDCQYNEDSDEYRCKCYRNNCNRPITFEQFQEKGYQLKPYPY